MFTAALPAAPRWARIDPDKLRERQPMPGMRDALACLNVNRIRLRYSEGRADASWRFCEFQREPAAAQGQRRYSSMVGIHIVPAEPESQGSAERRGAESD